MKKKQLGLLIVVGVLLSGCFGSTSTCYHQEHSYINKDHYETHYTHSHSGSTGYHCYGNHIEHS